MEIEVVDWATEEFGEADLGDERLNYRLADLARRLGDQPQASLPDASGEPAVLKAAYRFFDNTKAEPNTILQSHIEASYRRMAIEKQILAIQDTTYMDWTTHPATTGLGPLVSASRQGMVVHSTIGFTEKRVPLGVIDQQVWVRNAETYAQLKDHKQRPIEEKESYKWLKSVTAVELARKACPDTQFISVGDRESDIFDLFMMERSDGVDLLVRAATNRCVVSEEKYLWAALLATPVVATSQVSVPSRKGQPARIADLEIHWRKITLRPPKKRAKEKLSPVMIWAVLAIEKNPPPGVPAVEWLLLSTVPVTTTLEALERLEWYACRWGIEVWHKVLKSGCRIEDRQLATADRLKRCLALYSVIAWRVLYATMLSRSAPDLPCTVLLEEAEWQALYCTIHNTAVLPASPPSLSQAVIWIARLGGFLNRKRDGHPGPTVLWKGIHHLADLTRMYRLLRPKPRPKLVGKD